MGVTSRVGTAFTFPCGLSISNRLIKSAMSEHLSVNGRPEKVLATLYTQWGEGGWGAVLTGNVMIDDRYLGAVGDTTIPRTEDTAGGEASLEAWRAICKNIKANGSAALMQLNHPGRQSPSGAGNRSFLSKNLAPSAIPLNLGQDLFTKSLVKLIYGSPAEMSLDQIQEVISTFIRAAKFAKQAGFDGVEVHAGHGFLLSSFLSPKSNQRTDSWGGTPTKRAAIVVQIIRDIRKALGGSFCIGVKMNSADQMHDASFNDVLEQVSVLVAEEIDFLELSGGSHEDPKMMIGSMSKTIKSENTVHREAYFLDFASEVRKRHPEIHLMLTGGFRTRSAMNSALEARACDVIGVGRPAVVAPDFPRSVIGIGAKTEVGDGEAGIQLDKIAEPWFARYLPSPQMRRALNGGAETRFYCAQMKKNATEAQ